MKVKEFTMPTFYIIPKVHKNLEHPPGRPIVSAVGGPLERVGKYVDLLLKDMVTLLPSYVKDTGHVLSKIEEIKIEHSSFLLGSIDVEALYTSIPHNWGLNAVWYFLEKSYPLAAAQNEFIIDLLEFALSWNVFMFKNKYYQQIRGTSMGAPWASAYACLHLGMWEEQLVIPSDGYRNHVIT